MVQLKENQPTLLEDVHCLIKTQPPNAIHQQKAEAGHGRITKRTTSVYQNHLSDFILDEQWAAYIKTVVQVHRSTNVFDTKTKQYINRQETAFFLANQLETDASLWHKWVVQHWGIENKNHYVLDVALQEDASRIRTNPYNFALLRSIALNVLRKNNVQNIKGELYQNSLQWTNVFTYPQIA